MNDDAESDSVDSLICACGSPMLMRFSDAHDVMTFSMLMRTESRRRFAEDGVHPERRKRLN